MNIILAGPCGIGKSTVAQIFAQENGLAFLDFDNIRAEDMSNRELRVSPCSVSKLDLQECLQSVLDALVDGFVLDIGGDTIFRRNVDNDERYQQVLWLKRRYFAFVVVLIAEKESLFQRFSTGKKRDLNEFEVLWRDWKTIGKRYWSHCADAEIDTTDKTIKESIDVMMMAQKKARGNYS